MSLVNTVVEVGTVSEPELKFTAGGKALTSFSLKVPAGRGKEPSYFDVTCWEGLAENVATTFHQGDRALVVGRLDQDRWTGTDGGKRSKVAITAYNVGADLTYASAEITRTETSAPQADSVVVDF